MYIYLTEEELEREENLFVPKEEWYERLKVKPFDIHTFEEEVTQDSDLPAPPASC